MIIMEVLCNPISQIYFRIVVYHGVKLKTGVLKTNSWKLRLIVELPRVSKHPVVDARAEILNQGIWYNKNVVSIFMTKIKIGDK